MSAPFDIQLPGGSTVTVVDVQYRGRELWIKVPPAQQGTLEAAGFLDQDERDWTYLGDAAAWPQVVKLAG